MEQKKILIIDSHKGTYHSLTTNLHLQNARILAEELNADLIWSYPNVNDNVRGGYEKIIFVHASPYSYTDYLWLEKSPAADLYYIVNEYNLGEPRTLWMALKQGRKYTVIANHPHEPSKIVMKYVKDWKIANLNALIYNPVAIETEYSLFDGINKKLCIYYGSFRKDRIPYFKKYLTDEIILSTHKKNESKFREIGVTAEIIGRINWCPECEAISNYRFSLYMEDKVTHKYYNFLANRFYEALNYDVTPIFTEECRNTILLSGYDITDDYFVSESLQILRKTGLKLKRSWETMAAQEKQQTLITIKNIIL